jgi:hypothetical protein
MNLFKPNSAGQMYLTFDGLPGWAYIRSVDGGFVKTNVVDEPIGIENLHIKHTSTVEIEPFSVELGMSAGREILHWIQQSWRKEYSRRHGDVVHGDFDHKSIGCHHFVDALITETTFPTLDGSAREAAYLKFKFLPESVNYVPERGGRPFLTITDSAQKDFSLNAFRLTIDKAPIIGVTKIEGFTVKQGIKRLYVGQQRFPQIEPTKIEFPNIVVTIPETNALPIFAWYQEFIMKGGRDDKHTTGAIEFLSPDKQRVILTVELKEVGLVSANIIASQANQASSKNVRFELYVGAMDLKF